LIEKPYTDTGRPLYRFWKKIVPKDALLSG